MNERQKNHQQYFVCLRIKLESLYAKHLFMKPGKSDSPILIIQFLIILVNESKKEFFLSSELRNVSKHRKSWKLLYSKLSKRWNIVTLHIFLLYFHLFCFSLLQCFQLIYSLTFKLHSKNVVWRISIRWVSVLYPGFQR